jgi:hypothetical protein
MQMVRKQDSFQNSGLLRQTLSGFVLLLLFFTMASSFASGSSVLPNCWKFAEF